MTMPARNFAKDIETFRRYAIVGTITLLVLFILFGALRGSHAWSKIKGEGNFWNYGSSLIYFTAGEIAFLNAAIFSYYRKQRSRARSFIWMPWALVGVAFTYMACDEMLTIHEKLGGKLDRAFPIINQTFHEPADGLITAVYGLCGIIFTLAFFKIIAPTRASKQYFVAGIVMLGLAVGMDVIPREIYINVLPLRESEELLEVFAGWAFLSSYLTTGAYLLAEIVEHNSTSNKSRAPGDKPMSRLG